MLRHGLALRLSWRRRRLLHRRLMINLGSSRRCRLEAGLSPWQRRGGQLRAGRMEGRCCRIQMGNERLRHPRNAGLDERHEGRPNGPRVAREDGVHVAAGQRNCRRPRRRRLGLQQLRPVVRQFRRRQVVCCNDSRDLGLEPSDLGLGLEDCLSGSCRGANSPLDRDLHGEARGELTAGSVDVVADAPGSLVARRVAAEGRLGGAELVQLCAQSLGELLRGWWWW